MSNRNPINPAVLMWARQTSGLSIDDVVVKLDRRAVTPETLVSWERGESSPNYIQLEDLAYGVYKRPLAIFFFPDPPTEETPKQSFRTLPDSHLNTLTPRMRFLIRQARAMQINLEELYEGVNPGEIQFLRDFRYPLNAPEADLAIAIRKFLGVELLEQFGWRSAEEAFKAWRNILEERGLFIFKDAFLENTVSGFCLYDLQFPVIYVNNSTPHNRQIFTLFHELIHLFFGTGGIDAPDDTYIDDLEDINREIEIRCNHFAGAFLVPDFDFEQRITNLNITEESIGSLASKYSVSREVILRRLLDKNKITQQYYEYLVDAWNSRAKGKSSSGGGNYYLNKGAYLGYRYIELAFSHFYKKRITSDQLAGYLGVSVKNIKGMEALISPGSASS